jgi:4-hydroxybenzoate polyprenyltransferase
MTQSFARRWATFVVERFPPVRHAVMVAAFFAGNWAVAAAVAGAKPSVARIACGALATLLIFFRLRVFDEIKDHETDRSKHPGRPLARGLITASEAKRAAAAVAAAEFALALTCGPPAAVAWLGVLGFSLLMYREFFAGRWLRPRMELYAVTHTLVAGWLGLFVAAAVTGRHLWELPSGAWWFAVANWAVFNVFEFARKTFGRDEERPGIESYSSRLGPAGAAALTASQALVAAGIAWFVIGAAALVGPAAVAVVICGVYSLFPSRTVGRLLRGVMGLWIVLYYAVVASCVFG